MNQVKQKDLIHYGLKSVFMCYTTICLTAAQNISPCLLSMIYLFS